MELKKLMKHLNREIKKNNEEIKDLKEGEFGRFISLNAKNEVYIEVERFIIENYENQR